VRLLFIGDDIFSGGPCGGATEELYPRSYPELLCRDFPFGDDKEQEWDALINIVYDPAQFFVSQYDFSMANDQEDEGSPSVQP
jgi:hypothetical protein